MWLKKIALKLILAVGITTISIISVYSYFNIVSQSDALLAEVERHAIQQSETIKSSTRYGMLLNLRDHIHENINTIGLQSCIKGVRIFNKVGEIIYSSNTNDIGKFVDKNPIVREISSTEMYAGSSANSVSAKAPSPV